MALPQLSDHELLKEELLSEYPRSPVIAVFFLERDVLLVFNLRFLTCAPGLFIFPGS